MPLIPYHCTMLANRKRAPFEQTFCDKAAMSCGGIYSPTVTAHIYDWW